MGVSDWTYIDVFMCELDEICDDRAFFDACELNQFWFKSEPNLCKIQLKQDVLGLLTTVDGASNRLKRIEFGPLIDA